MWATDPVVKTGRLTVSVAFLVPFLGLMATFAVAFRRAYFSKALIAFAGTSIIVTLSTWTIGTGLPPSFASLFALALLTIGVLRHGQGRVAVSLTIFAALSVAAESLRPMVSTAAYLLVVSEAAFGGAVGVGVYLR